MPDHRDLEQRFEALETRIAFQDQTIETLGSVVTNQQEQIDLLLEKVRLLVEQIGAGLVPKDDDTPPPHY